MIDFTRVGPNKYETVSTRTGETYRVSLFAEPGTYEVAAHCTCSGYQFRHACRHQKALEAIAHFEAPPASAQAPAQLSEADERALFDRLR